MLLLVDQSSEVRGASFCCCANAYYDHVYGIIPSHHKTKASTTKPSTNLRPKIVQCLSSVVLRSVESMPSGPRAVGSISGRTRVHTILKI